MMNETKIDQLSRAFKRLFALPISRSCFREIQNTIFKVMEGNQDDSNEVFSALISGALTPEQENKPEANALKRLINDYSIQTNIAKDVFERAEFVSLLITDMLPHPNQILFANHIKRVDGQEIHFITDLESSLQVVNHFLTRVSEAEKNENTKPIFKKHKQDLQALKQKIDALCRMAD